MTDPVLLAIISTAGLLLGGVAAQKLIAGLLARSRDRSKADREQATRDGTARDKANERASTDNEQARRWLSEQLSESDAERRQATERERELMAQVGELSARLARQEERSESQAGQINELKVSVAKWNEDYDELKAERDLYRDGKHVADNKLTAAILRAELAEHEIAARNQEIDRLKGQLAALAGRGEV